MPISPSPSSPRPLVVGLTNETTTSSSNNSWGPFADAGDFKSNALIIISVLFCVILLFLAFNSIIRFLFCSCPASDSNPNDEDQKPKDTSSTTTTPLALVFSKEMELATTATECAICLCEFVEGDGIRILPACNHGFHVECVEKWLALKCSCPTCRTSTGSVEHV